MAAVMKSVIMGIVVNGQSEALQLCRGLTYWSSQTHLLICHSNAIGFGSWNHFTKTRGSVLNKEAM